MACKKSVNQYASEKEVREWAKRNKGSVGAPKVTFLHIKETEDSTNTCTECGFIFDAIFDQCPECGAPL